MSHAFVAVRKSCKFRKFKKCCSPLSCFFLPSKDFKCYWMNYLKLGLDDWPSFLEVLDHNARLKASWPLLVKGDPVRWYTVLVESTKQLGLLGHVVRFAGANLRDETSGFWLEVHMYHWLLSWLGLLHMCIHTFIVINTLSYVYYQTSLIYLLDSRFMTIMIASQLVFSGLRSKQWPGFDANWYWILFYEYNELLQMGHFISGYTSQVVIGKPHGSHCQPYPAYPHEHTSYHASFPLPRHTQNKPRTIDPWVALILEIAMSTMRLAGQCVQGTSPDHGATSLWRASANR